MADDVITLDSLKPGGPWYVFESIGEIRVPTPKSTRNMTIPIEVKGYARRNPHDPNYIQILARETEGHIVGTYLHIDRAKNVAWVIKPAPPNSTPDAHWNAFWAMWK